MRWEKGWKGPLDLRAAKGRVRGRAGKRISKK